MALRSEMLMEYSGHRKVGCAGSFLQAISLALLGLFTLAPASATAQSLAWTARTASGPSPRYGHAMAYDSVRGVSVLFGGLTGTASNGETWEWNGVAWTLRAITGPSPRRFHAMAYDSARGVTVLFGGEDFLTGARNGETWEWNGTAWTQRALTGPSPRHSHAMAYDSARGVTVLFGGFIGGDETWEWNGTAWTRRVVSGPSPRWQHAMAYDATRGVTVLFGGDSSIVGAIRYSDTWEWNGMGWTQRMVSGPSPRFGHAMVYDVSHVETVLYGGATESGDSGETWEWNGFVWTQRIISGPSPRGYQAMAYDVSHIATVLFGGQSGSTNGETWTWEPNVSFRRAWFQGLGVLGSSASSNSIARAVSADGNVVVGTASLTGGQQVFRWTRAGGMVGLGGLGIPPFQSEAVGISGDGFTIVGSGFAFGAGYAFRWTSGFGMQLLPGLSANAASFDGSVIVGDGGDQGYRFSALTGAVPLGSLHGGSGSYSPAFGVSSDGLTIVGTSNLPGPDVGQREAFRWTPQSLMVGLGYVAAGENQSSANAVSANGLVVVGVSGAIGSPGRQAFRWTQEGGMQGLGFLPGTNTSIATGLSANGSVIVGNAYGTGRDAAFIWTASAGMRNLQSVLTSDYGLSLSGWSLRFGPTVLSADGSTIAGTGVDPCGTTMGWVAHLGTSPPCRADFNENGTVSAQDIFDFLGAWFSGDHRADFNGANCLTAQDIFDFLAAWFAGC